jgi:hypothetical protein
LANGWTSCVLAFAPCLAKPGVCSTYARFQASSELGPTHWLVMAHHTLLHDDLQLLVQRSKSLDVKTSTHIRDSKQALLLCNTHARELKSSQLSCCSAGHSDVVYERGAACRWCISSTPTCGHGPRGSGAAPPKPSPATTMCSTHHAGATQAPKQPETGIRPVSAAWHAVASRAPAPAARGCGRFACAAC